MARRAREVSAVLGSRGLHRAAPCPKESLHHLHAPAGPHDAGLRVGSGLHWQAVVRPPKASSILRASTLTLNSSWPPACQCTHAQHRDVTVGDGKIQSQAKSASTQGVWVVPASLNTKNQHILSGNQHTCCLKRSCINNTQMGPYRISFEEAALA